MQANMLMTRMCLVAIALAATACAPVGRSENVADPYEANNRAAFATSQKIDEVFSFATRGGGDTIPVPVAQVVSNVANNLDTPSDAVNDVLQGDIDSAMRNSLRFAINSTIGVLGLLDPATSFGLERRANDFGKTLYVWGAEPGSYLFVPVLGPMTERELIGKAIDSALNPLGFVLPTRERWWGRGIKVADHAADRLRYSDSINALLYDSADPYIAVQSAYLQNRQFELTGAQYVEEDLNLYEDLYE